MIACLEIGVVHGLADDVVGFFFFLSDGLDGGVGFFFLIVGLFILIFEGGGGDDVDFESVVFKIVDCAMCDEFIVLEFM